SGLVATATNVYVANNGGLSRLAIDANDTPAAPVAMTVPSGSQIQGLTREGPKLYATDSQGGRLGVYDTATNTPLGDVSGMVGSSAGLGAQPGGVMPFDRVAGTVPLPGRFVVTFQGIESLSVTTGEFEDLIKETKAPTAATTTITTAGGADSVDLAAVGGTTI